MNATLWYPADIYIYTPKNKYQYVLHFLLSVGYTKGATCTYYDDSRGFVTVQKIHLGDVHVDIIQSQTDALGPLASFWSSVVRNGITPRGGFLSDPMLTINNQGLLHHAIFRGPSHTQTPERTTACIAKYAQRGFTFNRDLTALPLTDSQRWYFDKRPELKCSHRPRSLGDQFTAVCRFNTAEIRGVEVEMTTAEWVTGGNRCMSANCVVEDILSDDTIATVLQSSQEIKLPICCGSFNRVIKMRKSCALRKLFRA
jgi:hypothetical protein